MKRTWRDVRDAEDDPSSKRQTVSTAGGLRVLIPDELASGVIGKAGSVVSGIAKATLCHLNVSKGAFQSSKLGACRVVTAEAKTARSDVPGALAECIRAAFVQKDQGMWKLEVGCIFPVAIASRLVGPRGSRINEIQSASNTLISIIKPHEGDVDEEMMISGSLDGILQVLAEVWTLQCQALGGERGSPSNAKSFQYSNWSDHAQSEKEGKGQGKDFSKSGRERDPSLVNLDHIAMDDTEIPNIDDEVCLDCVCFVKMQLPPEATMGILIGKKGSFMRLLKQETGAQSLHIAQDESGDGRLWIEVMGKLSQVHKVQMLVMKRLVGAIQVAQELGHSS